MNEEPFDPLAVGPTHERSLGADVGELEADAGLWAAVEVDADPAGHARQRCPCTAEFAAVTRVWMEQWELHCDGLVALLGEGVVDERQGERRARLAAIEDGILRRSLFTARRP